MSIAARARANFHRAIEYYKADLLALSPDQVRGVPMGQARRACDYTYEVIEVNDRISERLKGVFNPPSDDDEWTVCPDEMQDRDRLIAALEASRDRFLAAWDSIPEDKMLVEVETPNGARTPLEMMNFAYMHTMYHDAQLNMLQTLHGDQKMNWPM